MNVKPLIFNYVALIMIGAIRACAFAHNKKGRTLNVIEQFIGIQNEHINYSNAYWYSATHSAHQQPIRNGQFFYLFHAYQVLKSVENFLISFKPRTFS